MLYGVVLFAAAVIAIARRYARRAVGSTGGGNVDVVARALAVDTDPAHLRMLAAVMRSRGDQASAKLLEARAAELEATRGVGASPPPNQERTAASPPPMGGAFSTAWRAK